MRNVPVQLSLVPRSAAQSHCPLRRITCTMLNGLGSAKDAL